MSSSKLLGVDSPLRRLRLQPRFVGKRLTILVPKNDYYVQKECCRALVALGHKVIEVPLGSAGGTIEVPQVLGTLMRNVVTHKPDMLLTINYTGFDRAAWFDEIIDAMGLPTAVWFVDSPFFLALGYLAPAHSVTTFFSWDRSYVPVLQALGAPRVYHLPLATDVHLFSPVGAEATIAAPPLPASFVGHTLDLLVKHWHAQLLPGEANQAKTWAAQLLQQRDCLHSLVPQMQPPIDPRVRVLAAANYTASKRLRQSLLQPLADANLHVFGDAAWPQMLPRARTYGPCDYGEATRRIYQNSAVNLNVTNLQMPTAVNQRIFDVPASGAFLLTDAQPELEQYFEPGTEVVVYQSAEQLQDLCRYHQKHPTQRQAIVARALRRVLAEHTYAHRMQQLLQIMRAAYQNASIKPERKAPHAHP